MGRVNARRRLEVQGKGANTVALITCPECRGEVSDKAAACPRCGYPIMPTQMPPAAPAPVDPSGVLDQKLNEAAVMARQRGGRMVVDSRSSTEAVFTFIKTPNHALHGILTLFTAGLWGIVWLIVAFGGTTRETWRITVDSQGGASVVRT